MGYAYILDHCGGCGIAFTFNPAKVPSLNNVAFCHYCVTRANEQRKAKGLAPHPIHPEAYEACTEEELRT